GAGVLLEIAEQVEDVGIDVVGVLRVEEDVAASGDLVERLVEGGPVEETHLVRQHNVQDVAAQVLFHEPANGAANAAVQDENNAHRQADQDSDQEIGQDDSDQGSSERNKLVAPLVPHLLDERRTGQLDSRREQDCRQAR